PAASQVTQVERGGSGAPHRADLRQHPREHLDVAVDVALDVGEAGGQQRAAEHGLAGDAEPLPVAPGALAAHGREELVALAVEHDPDEQLAVELETDRDAVEREAVSVVDGAVQGI